MPMQKGVSSPGSYDQFYIYDTGIFTRRSVPVRKFKERTLLVGI